MTGEVLHLPLHLEEYNCIGRDDNQIKVLGKESKMEVLPEAFGRGVEIQCDGEV